MINYLFSKIDKEKGFTKEQTKYLKEDINNNTKIVFISSQPEDYERNDKQILQFLIIFSKIGINFTKSTVIDKRIDSTKSKDLIKDADIVFLMGGCPELQMKFILEYDLSNSIKSKKIIIGVSAGSMNQSKRVVYIDDFDDDSLKDYEGLALVNINIYPHVDLNNKSIMKEVNLIKEIIPLILLPNESFVRIKNNKVEIIGQYYE